MLTSSTVANIKAIHNDNWSSCHSWGQRANSACASLLAHYGCACTFVHPRFHYGRVSNRTCFKGNTNPQKWGVRSIFPRLIGCWLIWLRNSQHDIPLSCQYRPTSFTNLAVEESLYEKGEQTDGSTERQMEKVKSGIETWLQSVRTLWLLQPFKERLESERKPRGVVPSSYAPLAAVIWWFVVRKPCCERSKRDFWIEGGGGGGMKRKKEMRTGTEG